MLKHFETEKGRSGKKSSRKYIFLVSALALQACAQVPESLRRETLQDGDVPIILSTSPTPNHTPITHKLICYGEQLQVSGHDKVSIAVGNIRDYTGKQADGEGYMVTQGGSLMAYTALGHVAPGITIMERFDTSIADAELAYLSNRQLGDGNMHDTVDPNTGEDDQVPWMPYYGGSVIQSDYYIVGGITELNFNIQSGGGELSVNNLGGKARIYTMNVGVDLRIVGSQSLKVYDTVSYQKQISGYEVGVDIFRFFDDDLWDVYSGAKNQEPLQLAVRMAIESGILQILPAVTKVQPSTCLENRPAVQNDLFAAELK